MKEINIDDILAKHLLPILYHIKGKHDNLEDELKAAIKEIVEEVLQEAAEKSEKMWVSNGYSTGIWQEIVDKSSILNTKQQIKY